MAFFVTNTKCPGLHWSKNGPWPDLIQAWFWPAVNKVANLALPALMRFFDWKFGILGIWILEAKSTWTEQQTNLPSPGQKIWPWPIPNMEKKMTINWEVTKSFFDPSCQDIRYSSQEALWNKKCANYEKRGQESCSSGFYGTNIQIELSINPIEVFSLKFRLNVKLS